MWTLKWNHLLLAVFLGSVVVCQATDLPSSSKCPSTHFPCANGRCVSMAWLCDGEDDCLDKSDEQNCTSTTCTSEDFRCVEDGSCIPKRWTCDKDTDCKDYSDESADLCSKNHCLPDEFQCGGMCIKNTWKCDGENDCENGEDEQSCGKTTCKPDTEFQCKNINQCISSRWRCDRSVECMDGTDEEDCEESEFDCEAYEFRCDDGQCIQKAWACDGDKDCTDESDEQDCDDVEKTCRKSEFFCKGDGMCIHMSWKCDGDFDCEDQSDEKHCNITCQSDQFLCEENYCIHESTKCDGQIDCLSGSDEANCPTRAPSCSNDTYDCHGDGLKCISYQRVCDTWNDCGNYEDERTENHDPCPEKDPCTDNHGGCQQICYRLPDGVICDCHPGFKLATNSKTECEDVNECLIHGSCSQNCVNTKGSFKCECRDGYELVHHTCKATKGGEPELLLADRKDLRRYNLYTKKYTLLIEEKVEGAIAMDFHYAGNNVYWTDISKEQILKVNLSRESNDDIEVVVTNNVKTPDGLAVDWVHGNLYWTDTGLDRIEVASMDGSKRRVLVKDGLDEPRAIAVHPGQGWMFWTDWGLDPKIARCGMNGKHPQTIISEQITWPNGLTIDYVDNRLYWIDAKIHIIGSSDLDGTNRRLILRGHQHLGHPFSITVFEDYVYWSDWPSESIRRYNKFQKGEVEDIAKGLDNPMDIHILHPYRQPSFENRCGSNNGGCQQFCLPDPVTNFTCECQNGYKPDPEDSTKCVEGELPLQTTARPTVAPATPKPTPKPSIPSEPPHPNSTPKPSAVTSAPVSTPSTSSKGSTSPVSKEPEEGLGHVAVIVIAVVLLIALLLITVGVVVFRRYRKRNIKSMNFDNPVYRKTTMDNEKVYMEKTGSRQHLPSSMQPLNTDAELA